MKGSTILLRKILGLGAVVFVIVLLYKEVFLSTISTDRLKEEFWQGYDTEEFSAFLNFDDSTKHYYFRLEEDTFFLGDSPYGVIKSFNRVSRVLKVKSLGDSANYYYFGIFGE